MGDSKLDTESLGQRIKRLRKERGLSQIELAKRCGVTDPWISQVEQDKVTASPQLLNNIASTLKISVRDLLQDDNEQMELISRIKLIEILLETDQPEEASSLIESLREHPELSEIDSVKLTVLQAECMYKQRNYHESLDILHPLINRLETINYHDAHFLASIRNLIGSIYFKKQDFTNAHYNFRKADDLINRFISFDSLAARISYNVALVCLKHENAQESIYYLDKSYHFFKENNNLRELAHTTVSQGIAYQRIKNYEKAIDCFNQAKAILQALQNKSLMILVEHTMASEITAVDAPLIALEQLKNCLDALLDERDFSRVILIYSKLIDICLRLENLAEINKLISDANQLISLERLHETAECAVFYQSCAKYHFKCGNYLESIDFAINSSNIFGTMGLVKDKVFAFRIAVDAYQQVGKLSKALELSKLCNDLLLPINERSI